MKAAAVVINHNSGADLPVCLAALRSQSASVDVVLVDCASTDDSRFIVASPPAGVHVVALGDNRGYAGGGNAGFARLGDDVDAVGFFNPDCFPKTDFFAQCLKVLEDRSEVGGVAAKLIRPDCTTLDSCGQIPTPVLLRVRDRGYSQRDVGQYETPAMVLAGCGAGVVYRRQALWDAAVEGEVFPAEFHSFWEDFDLGWRVSNQGWQVVYQPLAVAMHRRGATAKPGAGRLILRRPPAIAASILVNRWATLLHNLQGVDFFVRLPVLLPYDILAVAAVVMRRPVVGKALIAALPRLLTAWKRRRNLSRRRLAELL